MILPRKQGIASLGMFAFILTIVLGLTLAVFPPLTAFVIKTGNAAHPYPGADLQLDYFLGVLWAVVLGLSILLWPIPSHHKPILFWLWAAKCFVALVLMLFFEARYGLDFDGYWTNAMVDHFEWSGFAFGKGTANTQHLVRIHHLIVPGSFHAAKVGFSMVGLVAIYLFFISGTLFLNAEKPAVLWLFGFFPSILFWSSTVGKDTPSLLFTAIYAYGVAGWYRKRALVYILWLLLGTVLAVLIRPWYAPLLLLPFLFLIMTGKLHPLIRILVVSLALVCCAIAAYQIVTHFHISNADELIEVRNVATKGFMRGHSQLEVKDISNVSSMSTALPYGVVTALFRPFLWEAGNAFALLSALENSLLLALMLLAILRTRVKELKQPFEIWMFSAVFGWAAFYGLIAYNLGSIVRYKLQIMPILVGMLFHLSRRRTPPPGFKRPPTDSLIKLSRN